MSEKRLRWGILGTATIARKNWRAILNSGNAVVTAVASRDAARSRAFVEACQAEAPFSTAPRPVGSYAELIESPDVDAVYVPLPTALRKEWVVRAAEAGKHVVCEKPSALNTVELREMLVACRKNRVQFMDGVMFVHSRRFQLIQERLGDGETIGEVRRITSQFSFRGGSDFEAANIRADAALEPAGCLGDLGWYCVRFALEVMRGAMPDSVTGRILSEMRHPGGAGAVPSEFLGEMRYPEGVTVSFYCSFVTEMQQWVNVSGTRGQLQIDDFVLPFAGAESGFETSRAEYHIRGCDFRMDPNVKRETVIESGHGTPDSQEANLFREFSARVLSGRLEPWWPEMAWKTQRVIDVCRVSAIAGGQALEVGVLRW